MQNNFSSVSLKTLEKYQKTAIDLALKAGKIMKKYFTPDTQIDWKSDNTPITIADRTINQFVIDAIKKKYPAHTIIAEEESLIKENSSNNAWVCDPIDGTFPFSHGYPIFTFSIAFVSNGEALMGIIFDPICNRLTTAIKGRGAFLNGKKIKVSPQKRISQKSIVSIHCDSELSSLRERLIKKTNCRATVFYSTAFASILVASGKYLAEIFEYNCPWDAAAAKVIVEEAGGKVTDLDGNEQRYDQKINGYIASNGLIHQELLDLIEKIKS